MFDLSSEVGSLVGDRANGGSLSAKGVRSAPPTRGGATLVVFGAGLGISLIAACSSTTPKGDWVYYPPPPSAPRAVHLKSFNSLAELVPLRAGNWGTRSGGFAASPLGIAYAAGHLYICDTALHCVHDWDLETAVARRITGGGSGVLRTPTSVSIGEGGRLFVADTGRGDVAEFDATGQFVRAFKPHEGFRPVAISICASSGGPCGDQEMIVADAASGQVEVLSIPAGDLVRPLKMTGVKGALPMGVAARGDRVWATDMVGGHVLTFGANGELTGTFSQRGDRYGDMGQPRGIAVDGGGVLYVADADFGHVHLFSDSGEFLMLLGGEENTARATPFPVGVVVAESVPESLIKLVPLGFCAKTFLFVSNSVGEKRINLFAIGEVAK